MWNLVSFDILLNNETKGKHKLKLSFENISIKVSIILFFIILSNINIYIKINYELN
jgi:hypothetical protein